MTDKTQPTAHAEITAPISADLRRIDDAGAKSAPITLMTEDRACKWAWDQVREDVGTEGWTTSESCNFYGFFMWGWIYRGQYETQRPAAPPAPAAVAVPDGFALVPKRLTRAMERVLTADEEGWQWEDLLAAAEAITEQEYAALAAAPAQAVAVPSFANGVLHSTALHKLWEESEPTAQRGQPGALAWQLGVFAGKVAQAAAAPAQAVAVPTGEEVLQLRMLVLDAICALETVPVTVSCGLNPSESAKASAENIERKLASIPAQEHATQLAGQATISAEPDAWAAVVFGGKRNGKIYSTCDTKPQCESYIGVVEQSNDSITLVARPVFLGAAHAQAQEDARDGLGQAVRDVVAEIERAQRKFPTWPTDPLHALAVLGEEFGELTKDVLQLTYEPGKTNLENMATEARQTAAMALRFYVSLPFYQLTPGVQHDPVKLAAIDAARAAQGGA